MSFFDKVRDWFNREPVRLDAADGVGTMDVGARVADAMMAQVDPDARHEQDHFDTLPSHDERRRDFPAYPNMTPAAVSSRRALELSDRAWFQAHPEGMRTAHQELMLLACRGRRIPDLLGEEAEAYLEAVSS